MKTLKNMEVGSKKVIVRSDLNVPLRDGVIMDDNRIRESIETLQYLLDHNARVIVMSHLGRVKTDADKATKSLAPVAKRLEELLHKTVLFCPTTRGVELESMVDSLTDGSILLVENTRFEDVDGKKESSNDLALGIYWASLGDLFVNDAFGTSHRAHASNVGIASQIPSCFGFLVEKEINILGNAIRDPKRPFVVVLGGAKVHDKISLIEHLVTIADRIIIGGGMSFTFLKAMGYEIGNSLIDEESLSFCKSMLADYKDQLVLPVDVVVAKEITEACKTSCVSVSSIGSNDIGGDIGPKSIELFDSVIADAKTVIMNGPMGIFENSSFIEGTKGIFESMINSPAITIVGGGDSGAAAIQFGYKDQFTWISTGGGASLELLEGKVLPGIQAIGFEL